MDPTEHHFGAARFPDNYLVLQLGDEPVSGTRRPRSHDPLHRDRPARVAVPSGAAPPSAARRFWRRLSLANLRPEEQVWVKFLLLLPVAALVVCIFRTVVGITTFGTFGPALLGLVCRDVSDFPWALGIFVGIMLTGWIIRKRARPLPPAHGAAHLGAADVHRQPAGDGAGAARPRGERHARLRRPAAAHHPDAHGRALLDGRDGGRHGRLVQDAARHSRRRRRRHAGRQLRPAGQRGRAPCSGARRSLRRTGADDAVPLPGGAGAVPGGLSC